MTIILYTRIHQIENIISVSLRTDAVRRILTKCVIYFLNMDKKEPGFDNHTGFFTEHCDCIIAEHALHILRTL